RSGFSGCRCSPFGRSIPVGRSTPRPASIGPAAGAPRPARAREPGARSRCRCPRAEPPRSEPHAVGVAVLLVALMGVTFAGRDARLAHDDHAGGAAVDAQAAPRADVLVD